MASKQIRQIIELILQIRRLVRSRLSRDNPFGGSFIHLETLRFLAERHTAVMKDVADHLSITRPSATSLVNGMATLGLIRRRFDRNDRRSVRLAPTAKGQKLLEDAFLKMRKLIRTHLLLLSDSERVALIKILKKLAHQYSR